MQRSVLIHRPCLTTANHSLSVMQKRYSIVTRMRERTKKREEKKNNKAWLSEARRFMEYEEYTMSSFKSHQLLVVKSHEEAGYIRRLSRGLMKIINKTAYHKQMSAMEESRSVVQIIEAMPKAALADPRDYFRGARRGRLAHEAKMSAAEIDQVIQKFENNRTIHECLTNLIKKGEDIPENSEAVFEILMQPSQMRKQMLENSKFNKKNRNRKNEVFDQMLNDNERMFESPWRRRCDYRFRRRWYQRDWRLYQPQWESAERLTLTPDSDDVMSDFSIWRRSPLIQNIYIPNENDGAGPKNTLKKKDSSSAYVDGSAVDPESGALQLVGQSKDASSVTVSASREDRRKGGVFKKKPEPWNVMPAVDFEVLEMSIPDRARNPYQRLHHLRFRLKKRARHKRYHQKRHRFVCEEGRHSVLRDVRPKIIGARNKQQPMEAVDPERFGYSRWELRNKEL